MTRASLRGVAADDGIVGRSRFRATLAIFVAAACAAVVVPACGPDRAPAADRRAGSGTTAVRVGHFPNVTHTHALIGHATTRSGKGWFEERLGPGVTVEWFAYNAGPNAMEALLGGSIDLAYVGPNPALNAHLRSKGADIRVIAGATRGGSALVVHRNGGVAGPLNMKGRRLATPQLGNTQDVAARAWLAAGGLVVTQTGGDVAVIPTQNPDQLALFQQGELDAVWTVEPWVSRLEREADGHVLVRSDDGVTTVLAASVKFLTEKPTLAMKFAVAHADLSAWIAAEPGAAQATVRAELRAETGNDMAPELLAQAWPRMRFTTEIATADFERCVTDAQAAGFLRTGGDVSRLVQKP